MTKRFDLIIPTTSEHQRRNCFTNIRTTPKCPYYDHQLQAGCFEQVSQHHNDLLSARDDGTVKMQRSSHQAKRNPTWSTTRSPMIHKLDITNRIIRQRSIKLHRELTFQGRGVGATTAWKLTRLFAAHFRPSQREL